jgi:UDP:flavonoid glycosyltransferase YjiC (YdhE family)
VYSANYLPGIETCRQSDLVICNGGSGSVYQALAAGVPVLGVASNLDQSLVMSPVERVGAGRRVMAGLAPHTLWKKTIQELLADRSYRANAQWVASCIARRPSGEAFRKWVEEILGVPRPEGVNEARADVSPAAV